LDAATAGSTGSTSVSRRGHTVNASVTPRRPPRSATLWQKRRVGAPWRQALLLCQPGPLTLLALCGIGALALYAFAFAAPYSIERGLERPLLHFGRLTGPSLEPTLVYIGSVAVLFALYGA